MSHAGCKSPPVFYRKYIMDISEAIEIIKNEAKCVHRANTCDRRCEHCDLVRADVEILTAYNMAERALQYASEAGIELKG